MEIALDVLDPPGRPVPRCCRSCDHWSSEISDWDGTTSSYCELNVFLPRVKQTCKRHAPKRWVSYREVGHGRTLDDTSR